MKAENKKEKGRDKKDIDSVTDSLPVSQKCTSSAEVLKTSVCQHRGLWHREDQRLLEMPSPLRGSHIFGRGKNVLNTSGKKRNEEKFRATSTSV